MLKYLKAAFLVKKGGVPVNVLGAAAFTALGFIHPGFWIGGAVLVGGFTVGLANNERFQKVVEAMGLAVKTSVSAEDIEAHRKNIIRKLPKEEHQQYKQFKYTCDKIIRLYEEKNADQIVIADTTFSLDRMSWSTIKLLFARGRLSANDWQVSPEEIDAELATLEAELGVKDITPAIRQAKEATRETLNKRRAIVDRRDAALLEINADLAKLEADLKLAMDRAGTQGTPAAIQSDYETGTMLYEDLFGEDRSEIQTTDNLYQQMTEME
jgi:hypothetical protein